MFMQLNMKSTFRLMEDFCNVDTCIGNKLFEIRSMANKSLSKR